MADTVQPEAQDSAEAPKIDAEPKKPPPAGGIRDKIKSCSRPELETLAFKLLDTLKTAKEQAAGLQKEKSEYTKQLAERDQEVEELRKIRDEDRANMAASGEAASPIDSDEHQKRMEKERRREREDLEAARTMCDELRSALDDARAEVTTLKETRAAADVFSMELADYAKKMSQLEKGLAEARAALESSDRTKEQLAEELRALREESGRAAAEGDKARESASEMRRQAEEEKTRLAELQLRVDDERRKTDGLQEELTKDRLALGRQLSSCQERASRLEEIVDALRGENGRLRAERETADARTAELQKDYDAFKNRARYVLEQRAKEADEEKEKEERGREDGEKTQRQMDQLRNESHLTTESLRRCEADLSRVTEQRDRAETEASRARREADESSSALANALDELRGLRLEAERATEEASTLRVAVSEAERGAAETRTRNDRLTRELDETRERAEEERGRLENEVAEERRRREDACRQLDERRERAAKAAAPVAAVYPQFSNPYCNESSVSDRPPSVDGSSTAAFMLPGRYHSTLSEDTHTIAEMNPERGLESVLFGEEACDQGRPIDCVEPIEEDPREEVIKLRTQLKWMTEMHTESETTATNLAEQIRVLKEEIRRLQRNEERAGHVEGNTEYLKNVIVKFISPEKVSGERAYLIPILHTMLRLNEAEMQILQKAAAEGPGPDEPASPPASASWGTYLPKWSGLS